MRQARGCQKAVSSLMCCVSTVTLVYHHTAALGLALPQQPPASPKHSMKSWTSTFLNECCIYSESSNDAPDTEHPCSQPVLESGTSSHPNSLCWWGCMDPTALLWEINLVITCSWLVASKFLPEDTGLLQKKPRNKVHNLETKHQCLTTAPYFSSVQPPRSDRWRWAIEAKSMSWGHVSSQPKPCNCHSCWKLLMVLEPMIHVGCMIPLDSLIFCLITSPGSRCL